MQPSIGPAFVITTNRDYPSVAALKDGNFVVTYRGFTEVEYRILSPEGQFLSGELVADMADDRVRNPNVAGLDNGGFVVIWSGDLQPEVPTANNFDPFFRIFDANGGSVTSVIAADVPDGRNNFNTQVTGYENGFAAAWGAPFDDPGASGFSSGVAGRFFSPIGVPHDNVEWINESRTGNQASVVMDTLGEGSIVFAFESTDGDNIMLRTYGPNASPFGTEQIANQTTTGRQFWPAVAALAEEDRFVVVWHHRGDDGGPRGIRARLFELTGIGPNRNFEPVSDEIIITAGGEFPGLYPRVVGIGGGGFVTFWAERTGEILSGSESLPTITIKAQYFDAVGRPTSEILTLYEGYPGINFYMNVAENELGALMLTWRDMELTDGGALISTIMGRVLEVPVTADQLDSTGQIITPRGDPLAGVTLMFVDGDGVEVLTTASGADGRFTVTLPAGDAPVVLQAERDWNPGEGDPGITAGDALDALRISVGLDPSFGPAQAQNYIAADFNGDGRVTAGDALDILRVAVGLEAEQTPRWVFVDNATDWDGVVRGGQIDYAPGIAFEALSGEAEISLTGILIGSLTEVV